MNYRIKSSNNIINNKISNIINVNQLIFLNKMHIKNNQLKIQEKSLTI
jgi:hypothetical protein